MERIEFRTVVEELGVGRLPVIVPHLGGTALPQLVTWSQLPPAQRRRPRDLPGTYSGLVAEDAIRWPARHFLGEPALRDGERTVLLGCGCGVWECSYLSALVTVTDDTVTWSGYRDGFDRTDPVGLRDVTFDRAQYEDALRATAQG